MGLIFKVGEKVVYPTQGVAKIEAIEDLKIGKRTLPCYKLDLLGKDLTRLLPVRNAQKVGLRHLIEEDEVESVLEVLSHEINNMPSKWKNRYKLNQEKIRSGSLYKIAEVFTHLSHLKDKKHCQRAR